MWYLETTIRVVCIIFSSVMVLVNISDLRSDFRFYKSSTREKLISVMIRLSLILMYLSIIWMIVWLSIIRYQQISY